MPFNGHRAVAKPDGSTGDSWHSYKCGHCGREVSGAIIAYIYPDRGGHTKWLQCNACGLGSVENYGVILPGVAFGPEIAGLPSDVEKAYNEARQCMSIAAYNAVELICRKLLMHVAVDKGAKERDTFVAYIAHLEEKGFVAPAMKPWVGLIQKHGTATTHRIAAPDQHRAESTLMFTAELLRVIYEMDSIAARYAVPEQQQE